MNPEPRFKLTLSDMMILVVLAAAGSLILRSTLRILPYEWFLNQPKVRLFHDERIVEFIVAQGIPPLLLASLAVVVLTINQRKRLPPGLGHRPGFALCVAATVGLAASMVYIGPNLTQLGFYRPEVLLRSIIVFSIPVCVGQSVIGAMVVMTLAGRGRPIKSQLDLAGYALGLFWILLYMIPGFKLYSEMQ